MDKAPIDHFEKLTREEILAEPTGRWDDYDLMGVVDHFYEQEDRDRAMAVVELILSSPDRSEMLDYFLLYEELIAYYRYQEEISKAFRWTYRLIAFDELHQQGSNRANNQSGLANIYFRQGDLDTGLALYTRRLQTDPGDIWTYNDLGMTLPEYGLDSLAVESLDRGLTLVDHEDADQLLDQLKDMREDVINEADSGALERVDSTILSEFRDALTLALAGERDEDEPEPYLPPITRLIEPSLDHDETPDGEIFSQGKVLVPELIRLVFDETLWGTAAPDQALKLLRNIRDTQIPELEVFSSWLDRAGEDFQDELITKKMGKVGAYTTLELMGFAERRDYADWVRISALDALAERVQKSPGQRKGVIDFMRKLLTREGAREAAEENFVSYLIDSLLDLDARELYPDIKSAFEQDRVDPSVVTLVDVHEEWAIPSTPRPERRKDGLYLLLKCNACGRNRHHFVQYVLLDLGTFEKQNEGELVHHSPFIMDHEIICPKCGAQDEYELAPMAQIALIVPQDEETLVQLLRGEEPTKNAQFNPRVYPFHSVVFGRPMHPLDGVGEYRKLIAAKPGDAQLHLRLGNLLRTILRNEQALIEYRLAYDIAPNDADVTVALGMAEHDFGDPDLAKKLYQQVVTQATAKGLTFQMSDAVLTAVSGLKALKNNEPSPWDPGIVNSSGEPLPIRRQYPSPRSRTRQKKKKSRRSRGKKHLK